jgi:hypothetical protein
MANVSPHPGGIAPPREGLTSRSFVTTALGNFSNLGRRIGVHWEAEHYDDKERREHTEARYRSHALTHSVGNGHFQQSFSNQRRSGDEETRSFA